jgi:hypothetical protein
VKAVPADIVARIEMEPVIEEPLTGEIVVDAEQVGLRLAAGEGRDLVPADAGPDQQPVLAVRRIDAAAEQIEAEPAALVLEFRLVAQRRGRITFAQILGLDELRSRHDAADGAHRLERRLALVDQRPEERCVILPVRIPVTVERREAGGGERFVDRRPLLDPGIAGGGLGGEGGELARESGSRRSVYLGPEP